MVINKTTAHAAHEEEHQHFHQNPGTSRVNMDFDDIIVRNLRRSIDFINSQTCLLKLESVIEMSKQQDLSDVNKLLQSY